MTGHGERMSDVEQEPGGTLLAPNAVAPLHETAFAALVDLGMSDAEIARYLAIQERHVAVLRAAFRV